MGEPCQIGIESTVVDMTQDPPMILRPGKLTAEDFENGELPGGGALIKEDGDLI